MALHARNFAIAEGASSHEVDQVVAAMVSAKDISASHAQQILAQLRQQ